MHAMRKFLVPMDKGEDIPDADESKEWKRMEGRVWIYDANVDGPNDNSFCFSRANDQTTAKVN